MALSNDVVGPYIPGFVCDSCKIQPFDITRWYCPLCKTDICNRCALITPFRQEPPPFGGSRRGFYGHGSGVNRLWQPWTHSNYHLFIYHHYKAPTIEAPQPSFDASLSMLVTSPLLLDKSIFTPSSTPSLVQLDTFLGVVRLSSPLVPILSSSVFCPGIPSSSST